MIRGEEVQLSRVTIIRNLSIFIQVREEEIAELKQHVNEDCEFIAKGGPENSHGKTNILLQTYISKGYIECFSLASDFSYIAQVIHIRVY